MCSVAKRIVNYRGVLGKIPPVDIIDKAIVVIVDAVSRDFILIIENLFILLSLKLFFITSKN